MLVGAVMAVVFTAAAYLLKVPEVRQLVHTAQRVLGRFTRRGQGVTS